MQHRPAPVSRSIWRAFTEYEQPRGGTFGAEYQAVNRGKPFLCEFFSFLTHILIRKWRIAAAARTHAAYEKLRDYRLSAFCFIPISCLTWNLVWTTKTWADDEGFSLINCHKEAGNLSETANLYMNYWFEKEREISNGGYFSSRRRHWEEVELGSFYQTGGFKLPYAAQPPVDQCGWRRREERRYKTHIKRRFLCSDYFERNFVITSQGLLFCKGLFGFYL